MTEEQIVAENSLYIADLTAQIVASYVANNAVPVDDVAALIASVHDAMCGLANAPEPVAEAPKEPTVPIKKSVFPNYIICLEDGKKFKSLKRHLGTHYNLTPDQYRAKWGLPSDYPMVAPNYSAVRSGLAKSFGLGTPAVSRPQLAAVS